MKTIKVLQKNDEQRVIFPFEVPDDGYRHNYYDPEIGAYVMHCHRDQVNGTGFLSLCFTDRDFVENEHIHYVHFDIEFDGEWEYDYDAFGDYVPHIGWLYEKGGKYCHFTAHERHKNAVMLDGGNFLIKDYGKYASNLCIITPKPWIQFKDIDRKDLNLPKGDISVIYGRFFKSKKGTLCFDTNKNEHILVRDSWGGAFNSYRGSTLPQKEALYYHEASSHGGGLGNDYAIYLASWRYRVKIEDI